MTEAMPYWRLSSFYFFYFATLGVLAPFWGLYLQSLGFDGKQIGQLMAILLATKIIAPNIWSWLADHSGHTIGVVRIAALLSLLCYLGVFFTHSFIGLALVMVGFSFFWNASLPQLEATTLNHTDQGGHSYGRVRLWGSVGFIILVLSLGPLVDTTGPSSILPVMVLMLTGLFITTLFIPGWTAHHKKHAEPRAKIQANKWIVIGFLASSLLIQASHAPFYTFFSIYLESYGYSKTLIGGLWAFGVICEILMFLLIHRLHRSWNPGSILAICFLTAALRWVLVATFPEHLWIIVLTQAMHAITFGAYHATAVLLIHRLFVGEVQHRGQGLYSSLSFGVGGSIGALYSGYLWDSAGPQVTFYIAALLAMFALVVTLIMRRAYSAYAIGNG